MTFSCFVFKLIKTHARSWSCCIFRPLQGLGRKPWAAQGMQREGRWTGSPCFSSRGRPAHSHGRRSQEQSTDTYWAETEVGAGSGRQPRPWSQAGPQPAGWPVTGQGWAWECDEKGIHRPVMSSRAPGPSFPCSVLQTPAATGPTYPWGRPAADHRPRGQPGHLLAV